MNVYLWGGLAAVIAFVIVAHTIWKDLKYLAFNSILGVVALIAWNNYFTPIPITLWSVLTVAVFGILGLIVVITAHITGFGPLQFLFR